MCGFYTDYSFVGWVDSEFIEFATEDEYIERLEDETV